MPQPPPKPLKPAHVLVICLCVVAALFAGSLIISWVAWQANKAAGNPVHTDQQP
jgi:hypothetical protein